MEVWSTSNVFKKGHVLRLEVSSSNFPRFDRNLNTGQDNGHRHAVHDGDEHSAARRGASVGARVAGGQVGPGESHWTAARARLAQGTSEYSSTIAYVATYSARSQRSSGTQVTSPRTITSHPNPATGANA